MIHETSDPKHAKISQHKAIRNDLALMFQLGVVRSAGTQYVQFILSWKVTGS